MALSAILPADADRIISGAVFLLEDQEPLAIFIPDEFHRAVLLSGDWLDLLLWDPLVIHCWSSSQEETSRKIQYKWRVKWRSV